MEAFRAIHIGLHSPVLDPIFWVISTSGLGWVQAVFSLILLKWEKTKDYVLPLLITNLISGIPVAQGLKKLIPRDRPSNLFYALPQESIHNSSFPSGHTTSAFAMATILILMTRTTPRAALGWLWFLWAALVGFSRVYRGVHWPTDVLAGAACGVFSGCLVFLIFRRYDHVLCVDPADQD